MRIVIDMQGAQTDSRFRGIGRVTRNLTEAIIRRGGHEVHLALNGLLPDAIDELRELFGVLLPKRCIHVWRAVPPTALLPSGTPRYHEWASTIYAEFLVALHPDAVFVPSLMEYGADNFFCNPMPLKGKCLLASVVHDFIPLKENLKCLNTMTAPRYAELLQQLRQMDVVFPISSFVRKQCSVHLPGVPARGLTLGADDFFCPGKVGENTCHRLSDVFGISRKFILYAGGLDERKNVRRLLKAYAILPQTLRQQYQLVLPCGGQAHLREEYVLYCKMLNLTQDDVMLLGYVKDGELRDLYRSCTLFVFPSLDEGFGLPVLEAIKCGAPVICSSATAVPEILDYADALFDPEDVDALCQKMSQALTDAEFRQGLVCRAMERAPLFNWKRCAEVVVTTMEELAAEHSASWPDESWRIRLERICRQLALPTTNHPKDVALLADALAHTFPRPRQPQLLVDIGTLASVDNKTGIQRVVRGIAMEMIRNPPEGWLVRFVRPSERRSYYVYAHEAALHLFGYNDGLKGDVPIEYGDGDIFLGLDLTLDQTLHYIDWLTCIHRSGVCMYFIVHDIIPILFPAYVSEGVLLIFEDWLRTISRFDGLVCVSETVAGEVKQWLSKEELLRPGLEISSFHHGADIEQTQPTKGIPSDADVILKKMHARPSILMVSTLEPRKGHRQTLAAMDILWSEGVDANLVLVGKSGWKMEDFEATLMSHHETGNRLFWLRGISDEYLAMIYKASTVLLAASEAEGFGLSIIEAARYGKPLILRDIPVFREVAADNAFYFSGMEARDLANTLRRWLDAYAHDAVPSSAGIRWITWRESCQSLLNALNIYSHTTEK